MGQNEWNIHDKIQELMQSVKFMNNAIYVPWIGRVLEQKWNWLGVSDALDVHEHERKPAGRPGDSIQRRTDSILTAAAVCAIEFVAPKARATQLG